MENNALPYVQEEAFPELVSLPAPATPGKRHNLALINKLLDRYGLAIDDKMSTVKIKSLWRYLAGAWKGGKNVEKLQKRIKR